MLLWLQCLVCYTLFLEINVSINLNNIQYFNQLDKFPLLFVVLFLMVTMTFYL